MPQTHASHKQDCLYLMPASYSTNSTFPSVIDVQVFSPRTANLFMKSDTSILPVLWLSEESSPRREKQSKRVTFNHVSLNLIKNSNFKISEYMYNNDIS